MKARTKLYLSLFVAVVFFLMIPLGVWANSVYIKPTVNQLLGDDGRFENQPPTGIFNITLNANGGALGGDGTVTVSAGEKLTMPSDVPTNGNLHFEGWCLDNTGRVSWDFNDPVYSDMILYAKYNDGIRFYETTDKSMTILSDAAKYNASREEDIKSKILSVVKAKLGRESIDVIIDSMGTLKRDANGDYSVGQHNVTLRAYSDNITKSYDYTVNVLDGGSQRVFLRVKAGVKDLGSFASGYFSETKEMSVTLDNFFDLGQNTVLTDYKITNAAARNLKGMPKELLSLSNKLKEFSDPFLIRNNTGSEIYFTPTDSSAVYIIINENGSVAEGYNGPDSVIIDSENYNFENRLKSASSIFMSDRKLSDGQYLYVIGGGAGKGNYYVDKNTITAASTYDYDGRKFAYATMMYRVGNVIQISYGGDNTLLTEAYENQSPYVLSGLTEITLSKGQTIDSSSTLKELKAYDDNGGTWGVDKLIDVSTRLDFKVAKLENSTDNPDDYTFSETSVTNAEIGYYCAKITLIDDVSPSKNSVWYRKIYVGERNNYSQYTYNNTENYFMHNLSSGGVKFNTLYGGAQTAVYVYDSSGSTYVSNGAIQWCAVLLLKSDGTVVYGMGALGTLYTGADGSFHGRDGERPDGRYVGDVPVKNNMIKNLLVYLYPEKYADTSAVTNAIVKEFIRTGGYTDDDAVNGDYYVVVYPNNSDDQASRDFGWEFVERQRLTPNLKMNIKGGGVLIGE